MKYEHECLSIYSFDQTIYSQGGISSHYPVNLMIGPIIGTSHNLFVNLGNGQFKQQ